MKPMLQAEWLKEKRSANSKLLWLVPLIFISFSFLMAQIMGQSPTGKSYIVTSAYNWYPLLILPIIISLLVTNNSSKERKHHHDQYFKSLGLSKRQQFLSKNIVVLSELFIILVVSAFLLLIINQVILQDAIAFVRIGLATGCLFLGSLPLVGFSFFMDRYTNKFLVILINFVCTGLSAIVAVESWWVIFPWSYSIRMMAPALGIHPNGTFLLIDSPLLDFGAIYTGGILGIVVYSIFLLLQFAIQSKGE